VLLAYALLISACGGSSPDATQTQAKVEPAPALVARVDDARLRAADAEPGQWLAHGRTFDEQRWSPLKSINRENVARLGFAWEQKLDSWRGLEATPLVIDGVLYTTGAWSMVYAFDAASGRPLWQFDPKVPRAWARKLCCDIVNRGVAAWDGRIYVGTLDGRLIAIDAKTGKQAWEVDTLIDRTRNYSITGAPRIVRGKVFIGNGGAEFPVRGYLSAYDAADGRLLWRFYTVPAGPSGPFEHPELERAAATWDPDSDWQTGGGGTVWDSMAYDPELDLLYVGTGNGAPWARDKRSPKGGDNLFLASILALRPDSGELAWHYQTTPGDNWDYTATQHIVLADLVIDGAPRKVLMQAPKNGFFYVLDRVTGELLSAGKFAFMNWASHVDMTTGRPVETGLADYREHDRWVFPSPAGAHNWQPMSYSPDTGLVYIPVRDIGWVFSPRFDTFFTLGVTNLDELSKGQSLPKTSGHVRAWDPVAQRMTWEFPIATIWNGGLLSTAGGLVLFGTAEGDFFALDARNGSVLKKIFFGTGVIAPPVSYELDGVQYVAVMAGWGGPAFNTMSGTEAAMRYDNQGRVLVFKLDGTEVPLPPERPEPGPFPEPPPELAADEATIEKGKALYNRFCGACHGMHGSTPLLPDLRRLTPEKHALFRQIVLDGLLEQNGMAGFADLLGESDVNAIQAYIADYTRAAIALPAGH
jgi:quinohemoprotein ethanol dehydrogenase